MTVRKTVVTKVRQRREIERCKRDKKVSRMYTDEKERKI